MLCDFMDAVLHSRQEWWWAVNDSAVFTFSSSASVDFYGYDASEREGEPAILVIGWTIWPWPAIHRRRPGSVGSQLPAHTRGRPEPQIRQKAQLRGIELFCDLHGPDAAIAISQPEILLSCHFL